jgi:hypothetical protein
MTDEEFADILATHWETIAGMAFAGFSKNGRGVIALQENPLEAMYVVYEEGKPDPETTCLIQEYDPAWEIVLQYMRPDNSVRTTRIRTGPSQRNPWRIGLFDRLAEMDEENNS